MLYLPCYFPSEYHLQGTTFVSFSSVTSTLKLKRHSQLTWSPFTGTDCLLYVIFTLISPLTEELITLYVFFYLSTLCFSHIFFALFKNQCRTSYKFDFFQKRDSE